MICSECGQRLPENAQFCSACGRRVLPARIEPVFDPLKAAEPERHTGPAHANEPLRAWPVVVERAPWPHARASAALWSRAIADWAPAPHVVVVLGCALAIAIYMSSEHEHAMAAKAGAARIAAASGARPPAAQPALPGASTPFSAKQALLGLYGNYDPVLDGAYWTVTEAPKQWAEWNGRPVLIRPLVSRSDDAATRHVLVTSSVEIRDGMVVKQGAGCRDCKSLIGGALFERRGGEWKLVSDQRFLGVEGAFGAPPHIAVTFPAKGGVELRIEASSLAAAAEAEPGTPVLIDAGKKTKGVLSRPRPRYAQPAESPFPATAY